MDSEASVKVLRRLDELEEIREVWESWPGNRDSEIESYTAFLKSNPLSVCPYVVVVFREGRPDAALIGRIDMGHVPCRLGYLRLDLPAKIMCFVYGALRGNASQENCELILSSILRGLDAQEADVAYMNFLKENSELCRLARKRPHMLSRDHVNVTQHHYAAALPASIREFHLGLSPKVRKNQKWQSKKLVEHFSGDVTIRCFREVSEVENLATEVERLAGRSYQRGLGAGFHDNPTVRNLLRLKAERGWLRGYVLYLGGKPCAFWIGDINQGTFGSDYLGYDPDFGRHSPGMYLVMKVIEGFCDDCREGVTAVDFGPGHAQYKEVLSNQDWRETCVYIFAPTAKGMCFNLVRTTIGGMDQIFKKALARTNLLQRVKKVWRTHATSGPVPES